LHILETKIVKERKDYSIETPLENNTIQDMSWKSGGYLWKEEVAGLFKITKTS
jgi:hypothetical protein